VVVLGEDGARALASHLWFPRGSPHEFDRIQEANRRGIGRDGQLLGMDERPKPADLEDREILYYAGPLRRLVRLHAHQDEMSGFTYVSPWPRPDAWQRSMV